MSNKTDAQKVVDAQYRESHPIPAGENAEQKTERVAREKTEQANAPTGQPGGTLPVQF